jgi:hypothetical protein
MILELRTYTFRPGTIDDAIGRFDRHLPLRMKFSTMAGMWVARTGVLDRLVHIWPYDSIQQRMDVRAAAIATGQWPLPIRDILVESSSMIIVPASFSPVLEQRELGQCYELCIDKYLPGAMDDLEESWASRIDARNARAPLVACGRTEIGPLNHWVHLWAYGDCNHREAVAQQTLKDGTWPPTRADDKRVTRESILLEPTHFSLLR